MCSLSSYPGIAGHGDVVRDARYLANSLTVVQQALSQKADDNLCSWVAVGMACRCCSLCPARFASLMRRRVVVAGAEAVLDVESGVVGFVR
jgi:hypothetical protein